MAWVSAEIVERKEWAAGLLTLELSVVVAPVLPGQFVNLGLDVGGRRVQRSYSLASPPGRRCEFYLAVVPGGAVTPTLLERKIGDAVWLDDRAYGFFTLERVPACRHLWLIATGTGLGPFMAMLRCHELWTRAEHVVLVHAVRRASHLGYGDELRAIERQRAQFRYVTLISREPPRAGALGGRVTTCLRSGELERHTALPIHPSDSHVLLCGNPEMIAEVQTILHERGLRKHRVKDPGHISFESYW